MILLIYRSIVHVSPLTGSNPNWDNLVAPPLLFRLDDLRQGI